MAPQVLDVEAWFRYLDKTEPSGLFTEEVKRKVREYLVEGADIGLREGLKVEDLMYRGCRNLKLLEDFQREVALGRRAGPYVNIPHQALQCSPLGTVTKKHSTKLRTILHLSYPRDGSDSSVNSQVEDIECELMRFSAAVRAIVEKGRGCALSKFDIEDAFRLIRVRPDQQTMLGMKFLGWHFVELTLPFGLKSAPAIFEMFSTSIEKFIRNEGIDALFHYIDDFLLVSLQSSAWAEYETVRRVFKELGVPLAQKKLSPPSTRLEFLGLILDSEKMIIEIPADKLARYRATLAAARGKKFVTVKEIQQLVGVLVHSSMVIQHGRSFYFCLIQMLKEAKAYRKDGAPSAAPLELTAGAIRELQWWDHFIVHWNGKSMMAPSLSDFASQRQHHLFTDACETGMGAWFDGREFISHVWDGIELSRAFREQALPMPYLELLAVVHAVGVWREELRGRALVIHVDCLGAVQVLTSGYSSEKNMMFLLRQLIYFTALNDIFMRVEHIEGKKNKIADKLSRLTECPSDSCIDFVPFYDTLQELGIRTSPTRLKRREIRPFPPMHWNGLLRSSRGKHSR